MRRKKYILLAVVLLFGILLTACSNGPEDRPNHEESDISSEAIFTEQELPDETTGGNEMLSLQHISFYGDSITSYDGYSNNAEVNTSLQGQAVYYSSGVMPVENTWWYRVSAGLQLSLCVNNSYAGDYAASEGALKRAENLHTNDGTIPDIVVIYFGINDYNLGFDVQVFQNNYFSILRAMKNSYPQAEIFCCTLLPRHETQDTRLMNYNSAIRNAALAAGTHLIDLYTLCGQAVMKNLGKYTLDGLHPSGFGMKLMGEQIEAELRNFLDKQ